MKDIIWNIFCLVILQSQKKHKLIKNINGFIKMHFVCILVEFYAVYVS